MQHTFFAYDAAEIRRQLKLEENRYITAISRTQGVQDVNKIKERMILLQAQLNRTVKESHQAV
jgi:hypothetical protein